MDNHKKVLTSYKVIVNVYLHLHVSIEFIQYSSAGCLSTLRLCML